MAPKRKGEPVANALAVTTAKEAGPKQRGGAGRGQGRKRPHGVDDPVLPKKVQKTMADTSDSEAAADDLMPSP